jgi:hypothetical protein
MGAGRSDAEVSPAAACALRSVVFALLAVVGCSDDPVVTPRPPTCDGADVRIDDRNCGLCGNECGAGTACFGGLCTKPARLLEPRAGHGSVTGADGKIYVVGGAAAAGTSLAAAVESFDPYENRWTRGSPLSPPRTYLGVTMLGSEIFAVGGSRVSSVQNQYEVPDVDAYDFANDSWKGGDDLPEGRQDLAVTTVGERIFVFGGISWPHHELLDTVTERDPLSGNWASPRSVLAQPFAGARAVTLLDGTVLLCGFWNSGLERATFRFDPSSGQASRKADMLETQQLGAATLGIDGRVYYAGGFTEAVEAYDAALNEWSLVAPMPDTRFDVAAATGHDGRIYVTGGGILSGTTDSVFVYLPARGEWIQ